VQSCTIEIQSVVTLLQSIPSRRTNKFGCQPKIANCSGLDVNKTELKATAEAALKAEMEAFEDVQELLCQNLSAGQLVEVLKLNGIDPVRTRVF
jgi:hypothetical protein